VRRATSGTSWCSVTPLARAGRRVAGWEPEVRTPAGARAIAALTRAPSPGGRTRSSVSAAG